MIQRKNIVIIVALSMLMCVVLYYVFIIIPRQGKVAVEVLVNPQNAQIYTDNHKSSPGTIYLSPGSHTFKAEKAGWKTDELVVSVSDKLHTIALLPTPVSVDAKQQAKQDTLTREGLSGIAANARGLDIRNANSFIDNLPYSDSSGPFKIDYGFNQSDKKTPYIIISYSTPNGRRKAINWLKDSSVDITKTEILFSDYESPIYKQEDLYEIE